MISAVAVGVVTRKATDVSAGLSDGRLRAPSEFSHGVFLGGGLVITVLGLFAAVVESPLMWLIALGYPASVLAAIRIGIWNFFRPQWRPSVGYWFGNAVAGFAAFAVLYWLIVDSSVHDVVLAAGLLVCPFVLAVVGGQAILGVATSRRHAAPRTSAEQLAEVKDPQQDSTTRGALTGTHVFAMILVAAGVLAVFVVTQTSERTAEIREVACGNNTTAYHLSIEDSQAAWGAQFGMVSELPHELSGQTSVNGELRDGVFYGPHGLVVRNLTQASLSCELS